MSSAIQNVISGAAATAIQPSQTGNAPREGVANPDPNQAAQISQAAAQRTTARLEEDKKRTVQVPKRTEGLFSSKEDHEAEKERDIEEAAQDGNELPHPEPNINVVA